MNTKPIFHKSSRRRAIWDGYTWIVYGKYSPMFAVQQREMAIRIVVHGWPHS